jgi:Icc-related predicted phosphoesterase
VPGGKDPVDAAYASNLEALIEAHGPTLWVHGHIHTCSDYRIENTRIVCNPRGYPDVESGFNASFIVDLPEAAPP